MLRRAAEFPTPPAIQIDLQPDAVDEGLRRFFYEPTLELLRERTIRIEPPDWTGLDVAVLG